jgi:hypothetical protein
MPSIRKTIVFAFTAALAVVSLVYFAYRPKPPNPRQTVKTLHELGILRKGYDGWLAHVEAELLAIGETRPANPLLPLDDSRLRSATIVRVTAKGDVSLNTKAMTSDAFVAVLKRASEGQTDLAPLLFEIPLEAPLSAVEPIARAINDGGFGAHQLLKIVGGEVLLEHSGVYSIKLGGRFIRL